MRAPVAILLGSNIAPERHLRKAIRILQRHPALELLAVSGVYRSVSVGAEGPPFLNAALVATTPEPPIALKYDVLRPIERRLGRIRTEDPNAPRTIDLDIALYGDQRVSVTGGDRPIEVPDPDILHHPHAAVPLADVVPQVVHPVAGRTIADIAGSLADRGALHRTRLDLGDGRELRIPSTASQRRGRGSDTTATRVG